MIFESALKTINIQSNSCNLNKSCSSDKLSKILLPNLLIKDSNYKCDFNLYHIQSIEKKIVIEDNVIYLFDCWSKDSIPGYVYFFIYKIFDYLYSLSNFYALHASCVEINGLATLFIGNPGSGKTSSAINMCLMKGYSLLSNNRTIVTIKNGELYIIAGTYNISIRNKDLHRYKQFLTNTCNYQQSETGFSLLEPKDLRIKYKTASLEKPVKVKNIIKVDIGNRENTWETITNFNAQIILNENISKTQWGECLLFDNSSISPKLTTDKEDQKRLNFVNRILEILPVYNVTGDIENLITYVEKLNI